MIETQFNLPSPLQALHHDSFKQHNIECWIKRDDLIHPIISGNKWRKLKYLLRRAQTDQASTLITFGGAYSNHLYATAEAGYLAKIPTIGIVRGEAYSPLNTTLAHCESRGMKLIYWSRQRYREKNSPDSLAALMADYPQAFLIPEGGASALALDGVREIIDEIDQPFDTIICPCGTGTTLAGLSTGLESHQNVLGFSVLKGGDFLFNDVNNLLKQKPLPQAGYDINLDYHFSGYAKTTPVLKQFIKQFNHSNQICLDPIYTAKAMYGFMDLVTKGYFKSGSKIVFLHTGGLRALTPTTSTI